MSALKHGQETLLMLNWPCDAKFFDKESTWPEFKLMCVKMRLDSPNIAVCDVGERSLILLATSMAVLSVPIPWLLHPC